jgi:hypothetical protein
MTWNHRMLRIVLEARESAFFTASSLLVNEEPVSSMVL